MASSLVIIISFFVASSILAVYGQQQPAASAAATSAPKCQQNGQSYDIGSMFDGTDAFYYCKRDGSGAKAEAIGCINNGQRVYDLALYQKGDNFYRCRAGDTSVTSDLWGCAYKNADGTVTPKSIACTWDIGTDPINYVQCCIAKGGTAVITQLYCLYTYRGGRIQINDGCYRVFPDAGVAAGCKRNADGLTLTLNTWPAKNSAEAAQSPQASGIHECPIDSRK
jgi:hypothetical protein